MTSGVLGLFFFFQAEDGIRDLTVTGVQTCALPIWTSSATSAPTCASVRRWTGSMTRITAVSGPRSEEHTSELQSQSNLVCRLLLEKKSIYPLRLPGRHKGSVISQDQ